MSAASLRTETRLRTRLETIRTLLSLRGVERVGRVVRPMWITGEEEPLPTVTMDEEKEGKNEVRLPGSDVIWDVASESRIHSLEGAGWPGMELKAAMSPA